MRVSLNIFMYLYELDINKVASISVLNNSNESISRLSEMGVMPGTEVRVVKKTPFGGPIQIKLNSNYIIIRKEDAQMIEVEVG